MPLTLRVSAHLLINQSPSRPPTPLPPLSLSRRTPPPVVPRRLPPPPPLPCGCDGTSKGPPALEASAAATLRGGSSCCSPAEQRGVAQGGAGGRAAGGRQEVRRRRREAPRDRGGRGSEGVHGTVMAVRSAEGWATASDARHSDGRARPRLDRAARAAAEDNGQW